MEHELFERLQQGTRIFDWKANSCWMAQFSLQGKMETKLIDGKAIAALVTTLVQEVLLAMSNGFENPWNILIGPYN